MAELAWYAHHESGAKHGFTLPLHENIQYQVRAGRLVPTTAPDPATVPGVFLTPEQETELAGADMKLSRKALRAKLLAQLAELGDGDQDEDDEEASDSASVAVPADSMAGEPAGAATRGRKATAR